MTLPRNKFTALAALWFAAAIYSLLLRESTGGMPPFPNFDKAAHFALFFAQFWLLAKAYMTDKRLTPYCGMMIAALVFAIASECAQAMFTQTREGSFWDAVADVCGAASALWFARKIEQAKSLKSPD
ncbi:VanZ family protein [Neisseria yangbaofengii]|uniref:VanZ family protein n=1 Tax=Neisseria yangbaofengii TaxID=2709396 RepID=UPI0013ED64D1|nr:VanZ family protein [Neisseria yangbaofengii]